MTKAAGVEQYQNDIIWLCRSARPSGWKADGQIRISFAFHLHRDADCDNLLKVIQDAVAGALGINDRVFLPCVTEKTVGNKLPYTVISIQSLSPSPDPAA
jgi:Holliday junction resolvase RusA-like endonuclease